MSNLKGRLAQFCAGNEAPRASPPSSVSQIVRQTITRLRERRFARQQALRLVNAYHQVHTHNPELQAEALYAASLVYVYGLDDSEAMTRVRCASRSCASWPEPRSLRLRDVAEHVVVTHYMSRPMRPGGTLIDMRDVVARAVPENL